MTRISFAIAGLILALFAISACSTSSEEESPRAESPLSQPGSGTAPPEAVAAVSARPEGVTNEMIQEGQQVYAGAGVCVACHGPDGTGAIGPDLTDSEWLIGDGEYEQLVSQITDGVTAAEATNPLGAIMPPKGGGGITTAQVRAVAAYVWTLSH